MSSISETLSAFARDISCDAIPQHVRSRAKHLILDAVGIAHAATREDFAPRALAGIEAFGAGESHVIGMAARLPLRDAALMNGILIHGIDYDDTYLPGGIHASASAFPCALGMAAHLDLSGRDVLLAYVLGMEVSTRLSAVAKGEIHQVGFHPTGLMAAFGCAVAAGRLLGLDASRLTMAQGIASSTASGSSREYSAESAGNKRIHPGWGCVAGMTAASLAGHGFTGPTRVYEGRYGLFPSHAGDRLDKCDYALATAGLMTAWEIDRVAVKPYPIGQLGVSSIDAAITLAREHKLKASDVASMVVLVPKEAVPIMLEPMEKRRRPPTGYAAQFSLPYAIASSFIRGRFALADLEAPAFSDPEVLGLIDRIGYEIDPNSPYPKYYSAELVVKTRDGRTLRHREEVNRGAEERPITSPEIVAKFFENMEPVAGLGRAGMVRDAVLGMDDGMSARDLARILGAPSVDAETPI